jgi:drug/metabolite transporter (DMT)-like permease
MTKPHRPPHRGLAAFFDQPYLLLVLAPLFWGANAVAARLAVGEIEPLVLLAARCIGATLFIWPFAFPYVKRDWPVIRSTWPALMAYGAVGYATFNAFLYVGTQFTSGVNSSIEQASMPMLIMLANFLLLGVRAVPLQIVGVGIGLFGVILTATHGNPLGLLALEINLGDGLVLCACLTYTLYTLALRFRPRVDLMSMMAIAFTGATIAALVFLQVLGGGVERLGTLATASPLAWGIAVFVMIFPSMFSQLFYARGVELVGPNRAALSHNLIPFFGTLLSVLVLSEPLHDYHYVAGAIIISGIVLAEWAARRTA